jgi:methyl-accepting chemotaxis protein
MNNRNDRGGHFAQRRINGILNRLSGLRIRLLAVISLAVLPVFAVLYRAVDRHFIRDALIPCLVLALILAIAWIYVGNFILRPVQSLLRATRRVAEGDKDVRIGPPYGNGELGELAKEFALRKKLSSDHPQLAARNLPGNAGGQIPYGEPGARGNARVRIRGRTAES